MLFFSKPNGLKFRRSKIKIYLKGHIKQNLRGLNDFIRGYSLFGKKLDTLSKTLEKLLPLARPLKVMQLHASNASLRDS